MILFGSIFFLTLSLTTAYTCVQNHHPLPRARDCHILIDALEILSTNPPYSRPLLWSRRVNDTDGSSRIPKSYRLVGTFPNSCAIHVDAVPKNPNAEDTFMIKNVGNIAEIIVEQCLVREQKVGFGYPGIRGNIQVSIIRADGYWWGPNEAEETVKRYGSGLIEVTGIAAGSENGTGGGETVLAIDVQ